MEYVSLIDITLRSKAQYLELFLSLFQIYVNNCNYNNVLSIIKDFV